MASKSDKSTDLENEELKKLNEEIEEEGEKYDQAADTGNLTDMNISMENREKLIKRKRQLEFDINLEKLSLENIVKELEVINKKIQEAQGDGNRKQIRVLMMKRMAFDSRKKTLERQGEIAKVKGMIKKKRKKRG